MRGVSVTSDGANHFRILVAVTNASNYTVILIGISNRRSQPKFATKIELRDAAMRELNVSKSSFDFGWIDAIERTAPRLV